jgi:hypothetical protein
MKVGMIALTAALMMLAMPAWAGPADPCGTNPTDTDSDTVCDALDNCSAIAGGQCDSDSDGYGNPCDGDFNQDGFVTGVDFSPVFLAAFAAGVDSGAGEDMNCDNFVTGVDFSPSFLNQFAAGVPGPSGLACAGTAPCP